MSNWRAGRTSWRVPERDQGFVFFVVVVLLPFQLSIVQLCKEMASSINSVYHITVFSWYAFIVKTLADKDGEELPAGIFVYGGPWKYLTFLNLVRHCCLHIWVMYKIIHSRMLSVGNVGVAVSVAPDGLFRTGRLKRPAIRCKVRQHFGQM